jgi:acyl-coenzyme A synthetase/AMP-(fatty) acid ligase
VVADDSVSLPDFARAIAPILPFRYTIRRLLYEIPRTAAGKIKRGALADLVFSGNASPREALLTTDL